MAKFEDFPFLPALVAFFTVLSSAGVDGQVQAAIGFLPSKGATLDTSYYPQADTSSNSASNVYFYNGQYYSSSGGGGNSNYGSGWDFTSLIAFRDHSMDSRNVHYNNSSCNI